MGVERNLSNDDALVTSTRSIKPLSVDLYRPPALRYQSNELSHCNSTRNDTKNDINTTTSSISCNNSPTHANENTVCNTMTSPGAALLAHASAADQHSTHNSQQQTAATSASQSRRERRPDRAVYVPRARRSQTTPPATTTQSQTANKYVCEQQLAISVDSNGLVTAAPASKTVELSKNLLSKKSKLSSVGTNKERKERTKNQTTKTIASLDSSDKKNHIVLISSSDKALELETKEAENFMNICDNNSQLKKSEKEKSNTKSTSTNPKHLSNNSYHQAPSSVGPKLTKSLREELSITSYKEMATILSRHQMNSNTLESGSNPQNMRIEDVIEFDRVPPKCDIDEQELQRASKEINRSNRRIMKQTFVSDVLEIPEKIDTRVADDIQDLPTTNARSNIHVETTTDEEEEEDDWENMFDESGECLDPKIIQELTVSVGKVKIELPQMDYSTYLTKQAILNDEEFPHVLEVSNFPTEFKNQDLLMVFSQYKESGFDVKWVDDTHALAVFSSSRIAAEVLTMGHPFVVLKPLAEATVESRLKAKKCATSLQPYRPRPATCAALARRLVSGALGVRLKTADAERENEKRVLREAKERKLLAAKQRDEAWES